MSVPNVADLITIEPDERAGQPCIRHLRITVRDVLQSLAGGMAIPELLDEFPELTAEDVQACFAFAADILSQHLPSADHPRPTEVPTEQPPLLKETASEVQIEAAPDSSMGWMQPIIGILADEPAFEEVLAYGRAYRCADRPAQDTDS